MPPVQADVAPICSDSAGVQEEKYGEIGSYPGRTLVCNVILPNLLILWSGRPGSNRRRPAWELGARLMIQRLGVSEAIPKHSELYGKSDILEMFIRSVVTSY